jgi:hypothetical protein
LLGVLFIVRVSCFRVVVRCLEWVIIVLAKNNGHGLQGRVDNNYVCVGIGTFWFRMKDRFGLRRDLSGNARLFVWI